MSSLDYITAPFTTDPDALAEAAFNYIQTQVPGWSPNAGNLEVIMIEALAAMVADARTVASAVPRSIFRYYGNSIIGIAPIPDVAATVDTTWTVINANGYTIRAGTQVGMRASGDELIPFQVAFDVVVAPGTTTTAVGAVALIAITPGEEANGLFGTVELIDSIDWVVSITTDGPTGGGMAAESDDSYLNKLSAQLTLMSPRPILPGDFAALARTVPGVFRALAIDGYNPANSTFNNERMVAVALVDALGDPVSALVKAEVVALLEGAREVTFVVNVIDPTYSYIDVFVSYKALPDASIAETDALVEAALNEYLDPSSWGTTPNNGVIWQDETMVRYLELATVVNNVTGVDYIISLTMAKNPGGLSSADVALVGVAQLTRPNSITASGS